MKLSQKATILAAAAGLVLAGLSTATPAEAGRHGPPGHGHGQGKGCEHRANDSIRKILRCVTVPEIMEHQWAFQRIANRHGGTRASGTPGYDASAAYVAHRLKKAGYLVTTQEFDFNVFHDLGGSVLAQTAPGSVTYTEDTDFAATDHSEPGDVTAAVTPVDIALGAGNTSTSGCEAADFAGFPAGNIALIQRGTCTFEIKGENAAAAGASAIVFFNQGNDPADPSRMGIPAVTLGNGYSGGIPALSATYNLGATLAGTAGLRLRVFANVTRDPATTTNVLAESRSGDPANVVMAGAHLDSVPEGPGINDNGSGSSALLEIAEQLAKAANTGKLDNRVRFAWWGAEEASLVGSNAYVAGLTDAELANLEMYLNFDMVASPNYGLFVYDGDGSGFGLVGPEGSDDIEALFQQYFDLRGEPTEPSAFDGRSDYQAFINNGVPAGGLFTGAEVEKTAAQAAKWGGTAGVAFDPCYHQACDTIRNLSLEALQINSDAMAYVIYLYASGDEAINQ